MLFQTTPEQQRHLVEILQKMKDAGLDEQFIASVHAMAFSEQGTYDLAALWEQAENDPVERNECAQDLRRALQDFKGGFDGS